MKVRARCFRYELNVVLVAVLFTMPEARAWDPFKDLTGKNLTNIVEDRVSNLGRASKEFLHDPVTYTLQLPKSIINDICSAPAQLYEGTLRAKADGRWEPLPQNLVNAIQTFYNVNLSSVLFAQNIAGMPSGNAMTFGNRIYFPRNINLASYDDLYWMAHELEHTVQYKSAGNQPSKLCEYTAKLVGTGFDHDAIDMERAADRKADVVAPIAYQAMNSGQSIGRNPRRFESKLFDPDDDNNFTKPAGDLKIEGPPHRLWISNDTDQPVSFNLQTESVPWTAIQLQPHSSDIFNGNQDDESFRIWIVTDGISVGHTVPGGSYQHIYWSENGILDINYEQNER